MDCALYLQNAGLMWVLPIIIAAVGAALYMNNLTSAKSSTLRDQLAIVKRKHTWTAGSEQARHRTARPADPS